MAKKRLLENEFRKRNRELIVPQHVHDAADSIAVVCNRHQQKMFQHFESEEKAIIEFGHFLIMNFAEVTGQAAKQWDVSPEMLRVKQTLIV